MTKKRIVVLGIGNLLLKDEGVGVHIIESLRKEPLPDNVELVDGSVMGFDLLPVIEKSDKLIVIDAIKTDDEPGTIYKFSAQDVDIKREKPVSLHDLDFFQVLAVAKRFGKLPPTEMITIVPQEISWGMELSAVIEEKIPRLKVLVKEEIERTNNRTF